jgi:hypothetical protein
MTDDSQEIPYSVMFPREGSNDTRKSERRLMFGSRMIYETVFLGTMIRDVECDVSLTYDEEVEDPWIPCRVHGGSR